MLLPGPSLCTTGCCNVEGIWRPQRGVPLGNAAWAEAAGSLVAFFGAVAFIFMKMSSYVSTQEQLVSKQEQIALDMQAIKQQMANLPAQLQERLESGLALSQAAHNTRFKHLFEKIESQQQQITAVLTAHGLMPPPHRPTPPQQQQQ